MDPVLARRARAARLATVGKRIGYGTLLVAGVAFAAVLLTDFAAWAVWTTGIALVLACIILPIPIVIGYGVRAADRDDAARRTKRSARSR